MKSTPPHRDVRKRRAWATPFGMDKMQTADSTKCWRAWKNKNSPAWLLEMPPPWRKFSRSFKTKQALNHTIQ